MELLPHIKILLRDHERAFIPGLGGFVKEYVPARIDRSRDLFLAPGCTLSFNQRLAKEDGLLAERVMDEEGVSYEVAKEMVQATAQRWEKELREKKRLELDGVGILYRDEEGSTRFEPEPEPEMELSAYGLASFYLPPVRQEPRETEEKEGVQESETPSELGTTPLITPEKKEGGGEEGGKGASFWLKAAAISLPVMVLIGLGTAAELNGTSLNAEFLDLWKGSSARKSDYIPREKKEGIALELPSPSTKLPDRNPPFRFKLSKNGPSYTVVNEKAMKGGRNKAKELSFFVVGGCFRIKANAEGRKKELSRKGFPARILDKKRKGLHVVVFDAFAERNKALRALQKARRAMQGAWLLHRP